nr:reverse transcriptase domain-containing protein [Tanacetum cinerariifolium]
MVRSWQRSVKQKVTQSFEQGKEIAFPPLTTSNGTEGPLVIEAEIGGHIIHCMYIDGGSSMKILYEHCFNRLRPKIKSQMVPATTSLTGFSGETTWPLGQLRLLVTIGDATHSTKAWMNFIVVKSLSLYNGIIGRPGLKAIQAVPSTVHEMLKFPTEWGIVTICSSLLIPAECASIGTSSVTPKEERTGPANFTVALHPNFMDQEVVVGRSLSDRERTELCSLLKKNLDVFAWQPSDMTGVPRVSRSDSSDEKHPAQVERWAMPTWCHMFNSTLIGSARVWFDELPPESIDGYKDMKAVFLSYFMQQKKYVKDPVEIHNIKQRAGETIEDFMERFKIETGRHSRDERGANRFTPLTRTPKEILAAEANKFQPPPPMVTPVEKRNSKKFCDFHNDKGYNTDECMQLKKQIEELVRAGKLSHLIKEIIQGREQPKTRRKEAAAKEKPTTIYMVRSWQRTVKQKVTQSFEQGKEIAFPPLTTSNGTEGPLVIEAEIGEHIIHHMYIDDGSSMEILYEHCFNRLRPEIKSQMVPATTSLTGFSGETTWPLGQLRLLVTIGDATHSTKAWMNFMVVKLLSPYNGLLSFVGDRLEGGIALWIPLQMLFRRLQRLPSNTVGRSQVGRNIEVYVDDLVVKIHTEAEMVRDIEETFRTLRKCGPDDRAGNDPDANLLYKPRVTESGTKLLANGETGFVTGLRSKKTPKILFTDGSLCVDGSGAGLILTNPKGVEFTYALRFQFTTSNNEAEYEALVAGLRIATQMGVKNVQVNVDSKLVANQVLGTYVAKEDNMRKYLEIVQGLISRFTTFSISQVPRSKNKKADALSKIASTSFAHLTKQVLVEVIENKSIREKEVTTVKFLIVAMDYFTKWIEAKAVATITDEQVKKFVWDNIVCRFDILSEIISDNGKQFTDNPFKDWCDKLNITQRFASVKHPQSNGLVESTNRSMGEGIKACLREGNKNWVEELPHVLWAHRTMIKSSHGDTPFSLTYGIEAVIPAEIGMPTYHTAAVDVVNNDEELRLKLNLLEERRELAAISEAKSKSKMMKYYNTRVRGVAFKPGDLVYRSNDASHAVAGGKLGPKWEALMR